MRLFITGMIFAWLIYFPILAASEPKEIIVAIEDSGSFPIYRSSDQNYSGKHPGIFIEFLNKIKNELGVNIVVARMPWKRCLISLQEGRVNAVTTASINRSVKKVGVIPKKRAV